MNAIAIVWPLKPPAVASIVPVAKGPVLTMLRVGKWPSDASPGTSTCTWTRVPPPGGADVGRDTGQLDGGEMLRTERAIGDVERHERPPRRADHDGGVIFAPLVGGGGGGRGHERQEEESDQETGHEPPLNHSVPPSMRMRTCWTMSKK